MKRISRRSLTRLIAVSAVGVGAFFLYGALATGAGAKVADLCASITAGGSISGPPDGTAPGDYTLVINDSATIHN